MNKSNYLETDELIESIKALEAFNLNLSKVNKDLYYWKWAVIALHNAVQGFMVCALRGTNNLAVLSPKCAEKWMTAYRANKPYPKEKLDKYLNLYKKIKDKYMFQYDHSKKYIPQGSQDWSMNKLNGLRNDFIHFIPRGLSIEVSGLPTIAEDALDIISFLICESGNIRFDVGWTKKRCFSLLAKSKKLTKRIKDIYIK